MTIYSFRTIKPSEKSAHQMVEINDRVAGEVWREQVSVVVSKLTESRRMGLKWRWFARCTGEATVLGRGTRVAMVLGAGFSSKAKAAEQLYVGREALFNL